MGRKKKMDFEGRTFEVKPQSLGRGGQGTVYLAKALDDGQKAIVKEVPDSKENRRRLSRLIEMDLGYGVPGLSAPLAMKRVKSRGVLSSLATYSQGVSLEEDRARSFPELLQMGMVLAGSWVRLESVGIAHGDVASSNVMIRDDGTVDLIDIDNYALSDGSVADPAMIGQHAMMAPELRVARNGGVHSVPNIESDRFAWAVLFNLLLLGLHPADGLVQTPGEFDRVMSSGDWPAELRVVQTGEVPLAAFGNGLVGLFRLGFSLDPYSRPTAEDWYRELSAAVSRMQVHDCGGALVVESDRGVCPWCGGSYVAGVGEVVLSLRNLQTGEEGRLPLADGAFVYLGRNTLPGVSPYVSGKHVRLYRKGRTLFLEHVGRNSTTIRFAGESVDYALDSHRESLDGGRLDGAVLRLADIPVEIALN